MEKESKIGKFMREHSDVFAEGNYLDVFDEKAWWVALITEEKHESVSFRYVSGTLVKKDRDVSKASPRLAPFRFYSTGSIETEFCYYQSQFRYDTAAKDKYLEKMRKFMHDNFGGAWEAPEITKVFRGDFFYYAVPLISHISLYKPDQDQVKEIFAFIESLIIFILEYIRAIAGLRKKFVMATTEDLFLYMRDNNAATSLCYIEFFELLGLLFGKHKQRAYSSFKANHILLCSSTRGKNWILKICTQIIWTSTFLTCLRRKEGLGKSS